MSRKFVLIPLFLLLTMSLFVVSQEFYPNIEQNLNRFDASIPASNPIIWHDDCSNTSSFPDLATWYGGAMGSIASTSGYIYATNYGSASGSHGPVYYHTFEPALTVQQFVSLEVEIEVDGSSAMGAAAVMLYDSDYQRVAILDVADSWLGTDSAAAYTGWYFDNFTTNSLTPHEISDAVSESYHETLRMELNSSGLYGSIPRVGDFKMFDYSVLELERDITYLCVQFRQSNAYTPCQTMRIHDIKLEYDIGSTWHHDGSSMSPFVNQQVHLNWYNLLNWANGTWASSGDYLYPQSIDADSDWHGPTYVAELDQVNPLSSLSNFSVAIEAINDVSSYCGKHTVYLADDDFDLILGVHVNDAWAGAQQGGVYGMHRFKNYTGTDNGPVSATTFTGFNDSLNFRVEPGVGVYCYNPLYGETLLCEWDETEFARNVSYVILMSAQLDSNALMPFRVHDILLEFSATSEPVPEDIDPPVILSSSDISFEYGATNSYLEWAVTDENPDYYWIMLGALPVAFGPWDGSNIEFLVSGYDLGEYNFTLIVGDLFEQFAMDSVIVTIEDTTAPTVNHPADVVIPPAGTDYSIEWLPFDLKPDTYEIYLNGTLIETGTWNSSGIEYDLSGLEPGAYNYQVIVYDSSDNSITDAVLVIVEAVPDGFVPVDLTFVISIGSIVVIVVVIGVICRSKGQGTPGDVGAGYSW